jgi:hypothetical protein
MPPHYGNPHLESIQAVQNSPLIPIWESAGILQPLLNMPFPCEMTTQKEIHYLLQLQQTVDPDRREYCELIEDHHFDIWDEYLRSLGVTPANDLYAEIAIYEPVINYLKLHYNRARPYQLAQYYGIPFYPLASFGSTESAYPGGHTLWSLFIYHKYVQLHPELHKPLLAMVMDVNLSRMHLGLHYPSDGLFSLQVYRHIRPYMTATPLHVPTAPMGVMGTCTEC